MIKYLKPFFCVLLIYCSCAALWAKDIGLLLDQNAGLKSADMGSDADSSGSGRQFNYSAGLIPWFSAFTGDNSDLFISAAVKAEYRNETWVMVPELLRTQLSWRFSGGELTAGRMQYSDPLGFIAEGLFDGARLSLDTAEGTFSFGVWYTGLLYKKKPNITMTSEETQKNFTELDYSDFSSTYFAPRRIVSAIDWDHPGFGEILRMKFSVLGQFDLYSDYRLHSQYMAVKFTLPLQAFVFDLGGCFELTQITGADSKREQGAALAGEFSAAWALPTRIEDRLLLLGRFSSGVVEDSSMNAFLPVTTKFHGEVLKAKLSGLSMISLDYTARLHKMFTADISSSYFIRSDKGSNLGYSGDGYFLGNEFFGRLIWSPASDLQLNLGGGIFMPSLGDVEPDAPKLWRLEISAILSLY